MDVNENTTRHVWNAAKVMFGVILGRVCCQLPEHFPQEVGDEQTENK